MHISHLLFQFACNPERKTQALLFSWQRRVGKWRTRARDEKQGEKGWKTSCERARAR